MSYLKKMGTMVVIVTLVGGLSNFTQLALAKTERHIVLRVAYVSADRGLAAELIKWWGSNVEKHSGGRIKVEHYWGGLLGTSKEMLYSIERGTCDVGILFPTYFEKELPRVTINTCLISTFQNDPVIVSRAWWQLAEEFPEILDDWKAHNQKLLVGWDVGSYLWLSKKPINNFDDLKGLKCGVWGGKGARELFKELGSIAIAIPSVEVYDALDKGTMDARACMIAMITTYKYYEICKYVTDVGNGCAGAPLYAMSINLDKWKSIPPDLQKVILKVSKDWWNFFEKRVKEAEKEDIAFLKREGMKFLEFSKADKAKFRSLPVFKKYKENYIKRIAGKEQVAEKIYDRYVELLKRGE